MTRAMIQQCNDAWSGVALAAGELVATVVRATATGARASLEHVLSGEVSWLEPSGPLPLEFESAFALVWQLESGDESQKRFILHRDAFSEPAYRIYSAAAQIPIGYVTSYAAIARVAQSEARAVGRAMATNPLYPIVPCHRVIGSDFTMVGYGGKQDDTALSSKYSRLESEARGHSEELDLQIEGRYLKLFPVEAALRETRARAARDAWRQRQQQMERVASEAQFALF